jgi:phosphoribosylaminoimidazole-succinocarboxamide synthase
LNATVSAETEALPQLPLSLVARGKVRDIYKVDDARLLLVASDRISAFDVVLDDPIPLKGAVLTQLTAWWLRSLQGQVRHHLLTAEVSEIVEQVPSLAPFATRLAGRAMLCKWATVFPVECVIRGYIAGSAWKEYSAAGTLAGEELPSGLRESDKLTPELFSPATKAAHGHDENITIRQMRERLGEAVTTELERLTRLIYATGLEIAARRGIIVADTKFEFGSIDGEITLIDEVLTPDSSRFWPADGYEPGRSQDSFDKQPLRDYLDDLRKRGLWNGEAPAPRLSPHIVDVTSKRYLDVYTRLTGQPLQLRGTV